MKDNKRGWWGIKVIYAIPKPEGKTEEEQATLEDENGEPNF